MSSLKEALVDIREKLASSSYKNEEHVRLSLVARIIQELGWNLWNPMEVYPEFAVVPEEDQSRVDLVLFWDPYSPSVFLEIKAVGKLSASLEKTEKQLRDYNRNNTAMFSIITDGQRWRFYYSQTGGEFSKKCFKTLDVLKDDLDGLEKLFRTFLSKTEIGNGNAKVEAEKYLGWTQTQRAMQDALPKARRLIQEPPFPSLPAALVQLTKVSGRSVTIEEATGFIEENATHESETASPAQKPTSQGVEVARGQFGFELKGTWQACRSAKQVMVSLLQEFIRRDPSFLERCCHHPDNEGRTRTCIARTPSGLYPGNQKMERHAIEFSPGWYVDSNINNNKKEKIIKMACEVVGLTFGSDVKISL